MLKRLSSFFDFFEIEQSKRAFICELASIASDRAQGMVHENDYHALGAVALNYNSNNIFEIGTYLGVTSNFFLELLPQCNIVSIAYAQSKWSLSKRFNNSHLSKKKIGSFISENRRNRFTQLYGNSHKLEAKSMVNKFGFFDLVFIDGDHSRDGVRKDTEFAKKILHKDGIICWHDANPKRKYLDVRLFLEEEISFTALATEDEYQGGIACWNKKIEKNIK